MLRVLLEYIDLFQSQWQQIWEGCLPLALLVPDYQFYIVIAIATLF